MPKGNLATISFRSLDDRSMGIQRFRLRVQSFGLWMADWRFGSRQESSTIPQGMGGSNTGREPGHAPACGRGCAAVVVQLNGGKLPNVQQRNRIEKNGRPPLASPPVSMPTFSRRVTVKDCLDPAKKRVKPPELISGGEAPTVENIDMLLGQCIIAATDSDPVSFTVVSPSQWLRCRCEGKQRAESCSVS